MTEKQLPSFRSAIEGAALVALARTLPADRVKLAAASVGASFEAARSCAKDPTAYDTIVSTSEGIESLRRCAIQAALSGIMPGGASPLAYVIPQKDKGKQLLRYALSHRGVAVLAAREGWSINPVPVHVQDTILVSFGEVEEHVPAGDEPFTMNDLLGVCVVIRKDGRIFARPWISRAAILSRMARSPAARGDFSPWKTDPIPMAQKTAIHYCVARGILPLESMSARDAVGADDEAPEPTTKPARPRLAAEPEPTPEPVREQAPTPSDDDEAM